MEIARKGQISESMGLAVFLTLAGGFQDAYSYNVRDHVFANAQTGNIVLLGQNLAQGQFTQAVRYLLPLAAFIAGVYISEWIQHFFKENKRLHWRQVVLLIEILLLLAAGALPRTASLNIAANVMLSFACAMQVDSFRKFKGLPSATTMCIGNMRSATEALSKYHITRDGAFKKKAVHYYLIILIFAVGAAVGAVLSGQIGEKAIWIAAGLLLVGFVMMFIKEEEEERNRRLMEK
ncbi:MAG: YoaK family protein [Blautia sp.]|jgi:uncharacterized membrane protein YoaK (UPF0700 family)